MRAPVRIGEQQPGGVLKGYPLDRIYEEVAFVSYYFHWPYEAVMDMEHRERRRWCEEISRINNKINQDARQNV